MIRRRMARESIGKNKDAAHPAQGSMERHGAAIGVADQMDRAIRGVDRTGVVGRGADEHRRALLADLTGVVVEIGAGEGSNFAHYPRTVTEVLAVEPDDHLRSIAIRRAKWSARMGMSLTRCRSGGSVIGNTFSATPIDSPKPRSTSIASGSLCSLTRT